MDVKRSAEPASRARLAIDPALAEAVVEARLHGDHGGADLLQQRLRRQFLRAADPIYQETTGQEREAAFRELYGAVFSRLDHPQSLGRSLREFPALEKRVAELVVVCARRPAEEGTDLGGRGASIPGAPCRAILRIRPERFADESGLRAFLRFNWLQLGDLTDPAFAYEGDGLPGEVPPAEVRLLLEAYGLVWAVHTAARMRRRGWALLPEHGELAHALRRLAGLSEADTAHALLARAEGEAALTHADLLDLAARLRAAARRGQPRAIAVCALCRFAAADVRSLHDLPERARTTLAQEYPGVEGGVCGHCVERLELLSTSAPAV